MADSQIGQVNLEFQNSLRATANGLGTGTGLATPANYVSVSSMRTRLAAASAYYTTTVLDQMTVNDMVFALRSLDDKTTISNYQP